LRDWTDKEGNRRRTAEVIAENLYFCGSRAESGSSDGGAYRPRYDDSDAPAIDVGYDIPPSGMPASDFASLSEDDGTLPF